MILLRMDAVATKKWGFWIITRFNLVIIEFYSFPFRNLNTFLHTLELLYTILFTKLLLSIKLLSKILSELFKLEVSILIEVSVVVLVLN